MSTSPDAPRAPSLRTGGCTVVDARFVISAPSVQECPVPDIPEFAIAGRSNVGKSSLLNALAGRKGLARVSRTPGRTQMLNVFELTIARASRATTILRGVDLPGYGFAAAHREIRRGFAPMIEGYLAERSSLRALVLLIDARRGQLSALDLQLLSFANEHQRPVLLVVTKVDKLGAAKRGLLRRTLAASIDAHPQDILLTSASENLGLNGPDSLAADLIGLCAPDAS